MCFWCMIINSHIHLDIYTDKNISMKNRISNLKKIMKNSKIDKSIVIASLDDNTGKMGIMKELVPYIEKEKDLFLIGTLPIKKYTNKDIKELEKLILKKKIIGVKIYTGYEDFFPNDKRCDKIYDLCEKYTLPVIFHSGETFLEGMGIKYAMPIHIDEVAIKRPNLKIVIAHIGNPWTYETAVILNRNKNVYADISGIVWNCFDSYWKKHYSEIIIMLIKWCDGNNKLLFGTDWPCCDEKDYFKIDKSYIDFVNKLKISKKDKEKIFYLNAKKVFNI
jgi:uncharacterized protein